MRSAPDLVILLYKDIANIAGWRTGRPAPYPAVGRRRRATRVSHDATPWRRSCRRHRPVTRLADDGVVRVFREIQTLARRRLHDVDQLARAYIDDRDTLEPMSAPISGAGSRLGR